MLIAISYVVVGVFLTQIIFNQAKPPEQTVPQPVLTTIPLPSPTPPIPTPRPTPKPTPKPTLHTDNGSASPSPTPEPSALPTSSLDSLFAKYGSEYNVNPDLLKKIARCESGLDPTSISGDYAGLFQFASGTWVAVRGRMGLNSELNLRASPEESIRTAAYYIAQNGTHAWPNCGK